MSEKKVYQKLPAVLQTTAIKNFFESTVEQLFSKANVDSIQGYIGSPSSDDVNVSGKFLAEPTTIKKFYGLSPAVNTINTTTGKSENLFFYDELVETLQTYGVNTLNHNKIFSEKYLAIAFFRVFVCSSRSFAAFSRRRVSSVFINSFTY